MISLREAVQFQRLAGSSSYIDAPQRGAAVYDACVPIAGWFFARDRDPSRCRIRARVNGEICGETQLLFVRPDVSRALNISDTIPTGFRLLARTAWSEGSAGDQLITITASWADEPGEFEIGDFAVQLTPASLALKPYGDVVHPEQPKVLHRDNIYGSGPPVAEPGAETLQLLRDYLPRGASVVDVGCGAGAYGPPLLAAAHEWLGLETSAHCFELLDRRDLPYRRVDPDAGALPCSTGEFDAAICVEVLEHIERADTFLAEIARCIHSRALFSVPNIEVIPYFSAWQAVPWHLLEADHKNFFTRRSLRELLRRHFARVEVFSYAEHPLRTPEGIALHLHLFAVADK
ncbi:MAG TPA: class I SAM-dependent methyltransferase [Chthoniobacterales bacterium]|nr:class I SAM-dependent methyltransferase [Chthoniobacterales bacterium]